MRWFNCKRLGTIVIAMALLALLVLPLVGCAQKAPPPPPPPPPPPAAGTLVVSPPKIEYATLQAIWPKVATALGVPEAAVAQFPAGLAVMGLPIKFSGTGWPANDLITVELVLFPGTSMIGLDPVSNSIGIAWATADANGKFETTMESAAKLNWLLRSPWTQTMKPDLTKVDPLPAGVYTLKAVGGNPGTVTSTTWQLELAPPK